MILLMFLATLAIADEPVDRTESIYASYCASCHGESIDKIPLKPETTEIASTHLRRVDGWSIKNQKICCQNTIFTR